MNDRIEQEKHYSPVTRILAGICYKCPIRTVVDRYPDSLFGKVMRWHRGWCPAWAAYCKVYGEEKIKKEEVMSDAKKVKELVITAEDKAGMLADVTGPIAQAGVNITAMCAYSMEGKAIFMIVTADNEKVKSIAQEKGWEISESDVVIVGLKDAVGSLEAVAAKLKAAGVNLKYCYASTCTECDADCACRVVLAGDDADAVLAALA